MGAFLQSLKKLSVSQIGFSKIWHNAQFCQAYRFTKLLVAWLFFWARNCLIYFFLSAILRFFIHYIELHNMWFPSLPYLLRRCPSWCTSWTLWGPCRFRARSRPSSTAARPASQQHGREGWRARPRKLSENVQIHGQNVCGKCVHRASNFFSIGNLGRIVTWSKGSRRNDCMLLSLLLLLAATAPAAAVASSRSCNKGIFPSMFSLHSFFSCTKMRESWISASVGSSHVSSSSFSSSSSYVTFSLPVLYGVRTYDPVTFLFSSCSSFQFAKSKHMHRSLFPSLKNPLSARKVVLSSLLSHTN